MWSDSTRETVDIVLVVTMSVLCGSLLAAVIAGLLQKTHGVPARKRLPRMVVESYRTLHSLLPRWLLVSIGAGVMASIFILASGLGVIVLIIVYRPGKVQDPTEAYEGFGDAMIDLMILNSCGLFTAAIAFLGGIAVASRVAEKWQKK